MGILPLIGIAVLLLAAVCQISIAADKKTYIVHMEQFDLIRSTLDVEEAQYFKSSLESVSNTAKMLYKYKNVLNGYSVSLTSHEAEALKALPQVLSIYDETVYNLHTTRTPAFLGLDQQYAGFPSHQQLSNIIVGVFDTGVWPESKSFNDAGMGRIPSHWRGKCETGSHFTKSMCNKKLVGARFFLKGYEAMVGRDINWTAEYRSPRDNDGHGTHTSSTAAGSAVLNANEFGYAFGIARGMATHARVAMYKCCWVKGCFITDILAAMDRAIDDNVDVMSLSIGGAMRPYYTDPVSIGAFTAMENGIFVSFSAGNEGPTISTLLNVAPWITTVGAGTIDRDFPAPVTLGNGNIYSGISLYHGESLHGKFLPLVYAGNATNNNSTYGHFCLPGTLNPDKVRGKLIICDRGINARVEKGFVVNDAGGAGMILANVAINGEELTADAHLYLATIVGKKAGDAIKNYVFSDPNPTATIHFQGTRLGVQPAPVVAAFSSRGPNLVTPEILKPDLIAPGVNILAAWTGAAGPTNIDSDMRRVPFNIISGTSMSCPHISGLAALVKAAHPNWSPAAIRSALMTTAYSTYENGNPLLDVATGKPSTPFAFGAGHVKPVAALDPGLVYDLNATDYFNFLCAINYTKAQIKLISKQTKFSCDVNKTRYSVSALNYPSFAIIVQADQEGNATEVQHIRTLTNVGPAGTYKVRVILPCESSVKIQVVPKTLTFNQTNEKRSYKVTFKVKANMPAGTNLFNRLVWSDGKHFVGSPIAVSWTTPLKHKTL